MEYNTIRTSTRNGIFVITMNRPNKKNAMSAEMMTEITHALKTASIADSILFVVLTGAGEYYCSGNDMSTSGSEPQETDVTSILKTRIDIGRRFIRTLIDFPKLLIALVNGPAIGIAVTTLGLCDLVYAVHTATFWTPFSSLGLCAEGCASYIFPRIMGMAKATEVLTFGKKLSANEGKKYCLVTDVYAVNELEVKFWSKLDNMCKTLSKESILSNKKLCRQWTKDILHKVNDAEWDELTDKFVSEDFITSVIKFNQNRNRHKM